MAKALSVDLRERVVAAITGGLSCRAAARQFRVGVSSAIRWAAQARITGTVAPKRQGGDHRSARIEAHATLILDMHATTPDITLAELREALADVGIGVGIGSLWRFFERRQITRKKSPRMPRSRLIPIS
jgi:transposase